jgi:ferredoxin
LAINPDECIDCAVCVPECPENAIYAADDVPENQKEFIQINADLAKLWAPITKSKDAMPEHEKWAGVANKLQYLKRD